MVPVGNGAVILINKVHHFKSNVRFILRIVVNLAIEVPTAEAAIRTNDDHLVGINMIFQLRHPCYAIGIATAIAVQKVYYRKTRVFIFITAVILFFKCYLYE